MNKNALFKNIASIFIFTLAFVNFAISQNTIVTGKIKNNNSYINGIDLLVNHRYLDKDVSVYESNILEDGTFAFAVTIQEPQLVSLIYARNNALIYLEPNDSLHVEFDANSFKFSFEFEGKSANNNDYLNTYLQKHPRELDPFKYLQYKAGNYWYKIEPRKEEPMRTMQKSPYLEKMNRTKQTALMELGFFDQNNQSNLSGDFKEFMEAEIMYDWAYHMLLYGNVYKRIHGIDSTFFQVLKDVPLQNNQIGSHWYRMFLDAYMNQELMKDPDPNDNPYIKQYHIANDLLGGKALAYVQSEMISWGFHKNYMESSLEAYNNFIETNPYIEFDDKIVRSYQKAIRTAIGTAAPEFVIEEPDQDDITLSGMRGKVVLLNFWASWCRPCMKKMDEWKPLQEEFGEEVNFVHVSFDRSADKWVETLVKKEYKGIHVMVEGDVKSEIAQQYNVRAIPQYFIIDKEGRFAEKPLVYSPEELRRSLKNLNKEE